VDFLNAVFDIFTSQSTYVNGALFGGLLLFAASGEWIAERAGTINISVEAMLLAGAFTSAIGYHLSGSAAVGLPLVGTALFGQPWPFLVLYAIVPISWWLVFRTRWGLEVRASGEDPQAADVSGIDVNRRRRQSILYAGLTSGLGGAFLIFVQIGRFETGIVSGRGFIAIAAVIFGGWTLRGTVGGCVLFAGALSFRLSLQVLGYDQINSEFLQALPFLFTIVAMAVFATRVRPPSALARPFVRGLK
jgi:ABC-type uncharacterized transport system permease subunit